MFVALVFLPMLFAAVIGLATVPFHDVDRKRVSSFAYRQRLPITVANGGMVIRYLATTRRWRGTGLLLTGAGGVLEAWITRGDLRIGSVALFVGWFVGAVIAEWRVSVLSTEATTRTALLLPRRVSDYVAPSLRWAVGLLFGLLIVTGLVAVVATARPAAATGWLALTIASGLVLAAVARHVLSRAQPQAAADVLAADESIRSRSLHVLAGSALAILGYEAAAFIAMLVRGTGVSAGLAAVFGVGLPVIGVIVALRPSKLPTRAIAAPELTTQ